MSSRWTIELFGELCACRDEERITRFATQKTGALLAYLAFYRARSHPRETLIELLWPECDPSAGRTRLSTLLSYLRHLLEPPGTEPGTVVQADRTHVRLNPDSLTTDAAEFARLLKAAARAEESAKRRDLLQRAVALHKGALLPGAYEEWIGTEQTRLNELHTEALLALSRTCEQRGEFETALTAAAQALQADPYREAAHCAQMRLYATLGRPADVKQSYRTLEQRFRDELGTRPSAATRELAERLERDPRAVVAVRELPEPCLPTDVPTPRTEPPPRPLESVDEAEVALPLSMARFFGREREMEQLRQIFLQSDTRLVTITGAGGAGKTRTAIEAAKRLAPALRNRVWFVPLAELPDARLIPYTLARALSISGADASDPLEAILVRLNEAPSLLLLDNFEHLLREEGDLFKGEPNQLDAGTAFVRLLLERAPPLRCLVTSRRTLRLMGEQEFPLSSLPQPAVSAPPDVVLASASGALYVDRARLSRPDFALTTSNAEAVARLCRKLEGIPLAIELAAAWAKTLPPSKMLERLEERLDALTSRRRDLPTRHQSLRATIDWSYDLLTAPQQCLLARLAVFRGGWTLEAAEAVCANASEQNSAAADRDEAGTKEWQGVEYQAALAEEEILDLLTSLVEKSLVVSESDGDDVRYRFLETVRQYSADCLRARGETDRLQARHYSYFLNMATASWDKIHGSEQIVCLNKLEREYNNFRTALTWSRTPAGRQSCGSEAELALAGRLSPFWEMRGYWREGLERLEAALTGDTTALPKEARARALNGAGVLTGHMGDNAAARVRYEECLAIWHQLGHKRGIGSAAMNLGRIATDERDFAAAHRWYAESLEIAQELKHDWLTAAIFTNLSVLAEAENDQEAQQRCSEFALSIWHRMGESHGIATSQHHLSVLFIQQQNFPAAYACLTESLVLLRELGEKRILCDVLHELASAENQQGRTMQAVRLWGAVQRIQDEVGVDPGAEFQSILDAVCQEIGDEVFHSTLEQGRAMSTDDAVADALAIVRAAF